MPVKFSVVIPVKDGAHTIDRAIGSVLDQHRKADEIIVIDGHSIDNTQDKVRDEYGDKVMFLIQRGTGVSRARNQAVEASTGNYIAFLDADDQWTPTHLENIERLIWEYPDAGLYADRYCIRYADCTTEYPRFALPKTFEGIVPDFIQCCTVATVPVLTSVAVVSREAFRAAGGFSESHTFNEDHALWLKIALWYPVALTYKLGAVYHLTAPDWVFERYQFSKELACVTILEDCLNHGLVPREKVSRVKAYIGKIRIYTIRRNLALLMKTAEVAEPADCIRFVSDRVFYGMKIRRW